MQEIIFRETVEILKSKINLEGEEMDSVLEIGCGFPKLLIDLFHLFNFKRCTGVELKSIKGWDSIEKCSDISERLDQLEIKGEFSQLEEIHLNQAYNDQDNWLYEYCYKNICRFDFMIEPLSTEEFKEKFSLKFEKSIEDYLDEDESKFDLIICSKILSHLKKDINPVQIAKKIIARLNPSGYVFFRLNDESWNSSKSIAQPFSNEMINELLNSLSIIYGPQKESFNGKTHCLIIGKK